jgi:hypothetical protein
MFSGTSISSQSAQHLDTFQITLNFSHINIRIPFVPKIKIKIKNVG